jgi:hypothetical protein
VVVMVNYLFYVQSVLITVAARSKAKRTLDPYSYESKLSEYARMHTNNPNSSCRLSAHWIRARVYARLTPVCSLRASLLELGLFVRIRAYSDNLFSYDYGSNVRLA